MSSRVRPALLGLVLLAVACSRSESAADATDASDASTAAPSTAGGTADARSGGCGVPATPGELQHQTLTVDGLEREYLLSVPGGYDPEQPTPLAFDFHGLGADGETQARYSGFDAAALARGYVVVTPTGSGDGRGAYWILPGLPGSDDVAFFEALRAHVEDTLCIDPGRVYAAGISNGAAFASGLACDAAHALAGVASVSGLAPCPDGGPAVAVIAFHGTADPLYLYGGGRLGGDDRARRRSWPRALQGLELPPVEDTVAQWASQDGCAASPQTVAVGADVEERSYTGCTAPVVFYRIEGGGHSWPGAPVDVPFGPTTRTIDANQLILDFFASL